MNSDEMLIPHLKVTFCPPPPPPHPPLPHPPTLCRRLQLKHTSFILKSSKVQKPKFTASKKKTFTKLYEDASFHTQKTYKHFHDILRLFDGLLNFPFSKNEMMRDYHL